MNGPVERLAGVDYGRRRIGIALSDGLGITAQPFGRIETAGFDDAVSRLSALLREEGVDRVVYGLPMHMHGGMSEMGEEVKRFAEAVHAASGIPYEFVDERLTSAQAHLVCKTAGIKGRKRRARVDAVAAQILLQSYMDARRNR